MRPHCRDACLVRPCRCIGRPGASTPRAPRPQANPSPQLAQLRVSQCTHPSLPYPALSCPTSYTRFASTTRPPKPRERARSRCGVVGCPHKTARHGPKKRPARPPQPWDLKRFLLECLKARSMRSCGSPIMLCFAGHTATATLLQQPDRAALPSIMARHRPSARNRSVRAWGEGCGLVGAGLAGSSRGATQV
jgi:hypothetical protein